MKWGYGYIGERKNITKFCKLFQLLNFWKKASIQAQTWQDLEKMFEIMAAGLNIQVASFQVWYNIASWNEHMTKVYNFYKKIF